MNPSAPTLVACSRMYNLSPGIRAHWDSLFAWLARDSGIGLEVIGHAAPAPLSELWERSDMGAVFMCGYPFSMLAPEERPVPLAAPVSAAAWAEGKPVYASQIVTARNSGIDVGDLSTAQWGWTVRDSQSGYHAPRAFLSRLPRGKIVGEPVGPLLNPSGVVAAIEAGRIDVGAIDAYAYQLLEMHEPETTSRLRIVATTEPTPFPLLVASREQSAETIATLAQALLRAHQSDAGQAVLRPLGLTAFAQPDISTYENLPQRAQAADAALGASW